MASDMSSNVKEINIDIDKYRNLVQSYINLHIYDAALYWADKIAVSTNNNPRDVYWLAQCMYLLKQYHRAAHLLRSHNLDKMYVLCNYLTVKCLFDANELNEALRILNTMDLEVFLQNGSESEFKFFDDTPQNQVQSSVLLLKGKILEAMDNRGLAADCYRQALQCDVFCSEAFDSLVQHHMLTAVEEEDLINSLPLSKQCTPDESIALVMLYRSKLKKYHMPYYTPASQENKLSTQNSLGVAPLMDTPFNSNTNENEKDNSPDHDIKIEKTPLVNDIMANIEENSIFSRLQHSLDFVVAQAERLYYNCDYQKCNNLTESILKQDPYHSACLPIHISCQVELKQSNKLFTLSHKLVDLYPNLAISWFAVGCYYYIIGKSDSARRYLAKATSLDRLFGPAWLAYGHSFAIENEHDQAMAAYFKASQLMKGCHLPLLYIGLECGLTNNVVLANKFFSQAIKIAPKDPFVLHEMGVIAFQSTNYPLAEKHFREAVKIVKAYNYHSLLPERWAPLLNNLGHALRKQKKYQEALEYHEEALMLCAQTASTYSAIAYVHSLTGNLSEAVNWFHKALGLKRDDTFSTTMLNYILEYLADEESPYAGAPNYIPDFTPEAKSEENTVQEISNAEASDMSIETSKLN
ncbi:hypothetical protein MML48_6g00001688 [Holotrichia oblita]|uniref:Uncharacterized protein n=1 Tax=Holotrichia oblita TaxID=644536 RepID=A0ACB9SX53_HOLOL|nr:hypothetical protein MML48_6g00001688 [Holotrichia oblita]